MYKYNRGLKSSIKSVECVEGETIEEKIERIVENKEPITDGAPDIFTEYKDGVISAYNIRTDRWEIAAEAMDVVSKARAAKREAKAELKVVKDEEDNVVKSREGEKPDSQDVS